VDQLNGNIFEMKKVAISQSNYIPWRGYFDLIKSVDEFILYDDMQYTRRDWRNRNKIKTSQGVKWLTVPVQVKGKFEQKIKDTLLDGHDWQQTHFKTLQQFYKGSRYFDEVLELLSPLYCDNTYTSLSHMNFSFLAKVCQYLKINTKITHSMDYQLVEGKSERLVSICQQSGANEYISGPSAKNYMDTELFEASNISVTWFDYSGYISYPQLWGAFVSEVSILDLLFNCGPTSSNYLSKNNVVKPLGLRGNVL
jgi:hypothetical protein